MAKNKQLTNETAEGKGILFDPTKIKVVPIDDVEPNEYNPKDQETVEFHTVKEEIERKGLRAPVYVRWKDGKQATDGVQKYTIVDGHQRWESCKRLHYQIIAIYDWEDMDLKEAQEMTLGFQVQVPFNEIKLAHLLKDMVQKYQDAIEVPYTAEQIKNYLDMANFDWSQYKGEEFEIEEETNTINMEVTGEFLKKIKQFIIENEKEYNKDKVKRKMIILGTTKIKVLADAAKVIQKALTTCMISNDLNDSGRALELICADYLGGTGTVFDNGEGDIPYTNGIATTDEDTTAEEYQH